MICVYFAVNNTPSLFSVSFFQFGSYLQLDEILEVLVIQNEMHKSFIFTILVLYLSIILKSDGNYGGGMDDFLR